MSGILLLAMVPCHVDRQLIKLKGQRHHLQLVRFGHQIGMPLASDADPVGLCGHHDGVAAGTGFIGDVSLWLWLQRQ